MRRQIRHILPWILAFSLLCSMVSCDRGGSASSDALVGVGGEDQTAGGQSGGTGMSGTEGIGHLGGTEEAGGAESAEKDPAEFWLVESGKANFRVVYSPKSYSGENKMAALARTAEVVCQAVEDATGAVPECVRMDKESTGMEDSETLEILVGRTPYGESDEALTGLPFGDYVVKAVGRKIVVTGLNQKALDMAAQALAEAVRETGTEGELALPADICLTGTTVEAANALPLYDGGVPYATYDSGDGCWLVVVDGTNPKEYAAYREKLESQGYSLYTENRIVDNIFSTYTNGEYTVNAGYYEYEGAARITIEPKSGLPTLPEDNVYTPVTEPSISMLDLEHLEGDVFVHEQDEIGMSFLIQLSDGSFIVIDGGFDRDRDADNIYRMMGELAPDLDSITIAAWIISHNHDDHVGAFLNFSERYADKVTLEQFIANFPSAEAREVCGGGWQTEQTMEDLTLYDGAEFIKAHEGQKFYLRDAEVEILYTMDGFGPRQMSTFNTSSLIFKVRLAGQEFLFLGDATEDSAKIVASMYGDYLKSDFLQTAHHGFVVGFNSYKGLMDLYAYAAPEILLWPVGRKEYDLYMKNGAYPANKVLLESENVKEVFVAGDRDITLPLPYAFGTSGYESELR